MGQPSALALSDEEFDKLPLPTPENLAVPTDTEIIESNASNNADDDTDTIEETAEGSDEDTQNDEQQEEDADATKTTEEVDVTETEVTDTKAEGVNYEDAYKEIFKSFKANGKDMSVDSIEDVRQLMQMGANYNKKMAGLKPSLKMVKLLENNGLLDEEKLSYLIDLSKHNPDAIKKLIKDSGLDPLEVDINQEVSYKANTYNVSDKEMELDAVLSEIRESGTFNETVDIVGNKWDESSKRVVLENPQILKFINSHMNNGVYKAVSSEVEKLRILGKLEGLNDIDAYKAVGDVLFAPKVESPKSNNINTSTSKATNQEDPRLVERKKAASATKSVVSNVKPEFNPLSMSDDEFEKIASSKFI